MAPSAAARSRVELFWKASARTQAGWFGRTLGLVLQSDGGDLELRQLDADRCEVACRVPRWLCEGRSGEGPVSAAGLVALFDEASSFAGAALWDPLCRPGVSVHLSGVLSPRAREVGHGSAISIVSRPQRIGRTIGFIEVDVRAEVDGSDASIMRGRHVKFFPGTGLRPEWLMRPQLQPFTLSAAHAYWATRPVLTDGAAHAPQSFDEVFRPVGEGGEAGLVELSTAHANPLGALHGGASVLLASTAGRRQLGLTPLPVLAIQAHLISGLHLAKRPETVRVKAQLGLGFCSGEADHAREHGRDGLAASAELSAAGWPAASGGAGAVTAMLQRERGSVPIAECTMILGQKPALSAV